VRSHFLRDLSIQGAHLVAREVPDFDFYNLREVVSIDWRLDPDQDSGCIRAQLVMAFAYESGGVSLRIALRFAGVRRLRLPEMNPSLPLAEVEIEDITSHQLEGVAYRFSDYGQRELEVLCESIEILKCERVEG
jgi:hypothetical protein